MRRPDRALSLALAALCALALGACNSGSKGVKLPKAQLAVAPTYVAQDDGRIRKLHQYQSQLTLAGSDFGTGKLDSAEKRARAALKLIPDRPDALLLLAAIADRRGEGPRAGELLQRAVAQAPERGDVLNNYAAWMCDHGNAEASLGMFERAIAAPGYASPGVALSNAGACALRAKQPVPAERYLRAALAQDPRDAQALDAMAQLSFDDGRYMEARAFSERRLAAAPPTRSVLQLASQIETRLGDQRAADRYQQRIRQEFPQEADLNSKG